MPRSQEFRPAVNSLLRAIQMRPHPPEHAIEGDESEKTAIPRGVSSHP
jgi:hypothetical protein